MKDFSIAYTLDICQNVDALIFSVISTFKCHFIQCILQILKKLFECLFLIHHLLDFDFVHEVDFDRNCNSNSG